MLDQYVRQIFCASMLALICGLVMPSFAAAEDASLDKRLDQLERQLNAVQRKVFGGGSGPAPQAPTGPASSAMNTSLADMDIRMAEFESQLRLTTGQVEQANYKIEELTRKLDGFMKDTEFRFSALEGKGKSPAAEAAAAGGGAAAASGAAVAGSGTNEKAANTLPAANVAAQYDQAYALLSAGKYSESEKAFSDFLRQNPDDDLAANAQYWLAQTYYVRGNFAAAAKAFLAGYQKYPKSPKAPAYLLKIGITLTKIGQKQDACDVFRELATKFPLSPEAKSRRAPEAKIAGCK
jgi:tol-pal system protein YbgF